MRSPRAAVAAPLAAGAAAAAPQREFDFSKSDFEFLARLAYEHAGISLSESKRNLVYGRLSRRLRALGLTSFAAYRAHLEADADEIERFRRDTLDRGGADANDLRSGGEIDDAETVVTEFGDEEALAL